MHPLTRLALVLIGCATLGTAMDTKTLSGSDGQPRVTGLCLVAPDMLAITVEARRVVLGAVVDYVVQPGDQIQTKKDDHGIETATLIRTGASRGEVIGSGAKRQLITSSFVIGEPMRTDTADDPASYTISSSDDPAYATGVRPLAVHRKSKPIDYIWDKPPARHVVFLSLPKPLIEGRSYRVELAKLGLDVAEVTYRNDTRVTRSLAVHSNQIGYRTDDPFKRAYLSIWLGPLAGSSDVGAFSYPSGLAFQLLDDATGAEVFSGKVEMAKRATDPEAMFREMNFNGTDVLRMDFSLFSRSGRYRVHVDGIGCGYPFVIDQGADTWTHAFTVQMRGFFHQRSGIALGPPYTTFVRPRDHHPDDGVEIVRSTYAAPIWKDSSPGESDIQGGLKAGATGERVTNAWGGYHDAGDWNPRRVSHMRATMAQLEVADLFPEFVAALKWNIPTDRPVPDLFNEALFEIDCFRRMQTADGGIGYGLETVGDPSGDAVSWHTKVLPVYMAAPDSGNSWFYAAVVARAARLLQPQHADIAKIYAQSATKAMTWAEAEFAREAKEKGRTADDLYWTVRDQRNLAAIEMLRLTRDKHWHDVFLENTVLTQDPTELYAYNQAIQVDAAFAYAMTDAKLTDPLLRKRAIDGLEAQAKKARAYSDGNAFDLVASDKGRPMFMGFYSTPWDGRVALRAYHLTGKPEYLVTGLRAAQFSSGANPDNLVFTTGLGANPIRHPLLLDAHTTGQPAPDGITVYGIEDHVNCPSTWAYWILPALDTSMSPGYRKWPVTESYTDTYLFVITNEFTVDMWDESVWTWGYLAGRPRTR